MAKLERYIPVGGRSLRCGYTTGTCAAAAAAAAAQRLLTGRAPDAVRVDTPAGIPVEVEILDQGAGPGWAQCAARKDAGDDPDVTDGALICARVARRAAPGIQIDGGAGVGRVTRPGLDQGVGAAAINSVPRAMIARAVEAVQREARDAGGLEVVVSVPEGAALAGRTFNPRLGIQGGISILGTSGIVRPMSEAAMVDSLCLELDLLAAAGTRDVVVTPGNYGADFARKHLGLTLEAWASCSNYVGAAIDRAAALGLRSLLLVGHLGKLCKVAAGCMNTHSKTADARRETLTAHAALCGAPPAVLRGVFQSAATDEALDLLEGAGLRPAVMDSLAEALDGALRVRAGPGLEIGALFFSNQYGTLGQTPGAAALLARHRGTEKGC